MSKHHYQDYAEATMHQFKTHIAHYLRMMEAGVYKAVVVKRGPKPVGLFMPYPKEKNAPNPPPGPNRAQ